MHVLETTYPWYCLVNGDELEQGDILESCPVFSPPSNLTLNSLEEREAEFAWEERDVILMSQSCDLVKGNEKITEVLLCAVWNLSEVTEGHLSTKKGREEARRGQLPAFHLLNECELEEAERGFRVVDFHRIHALPLDFTRFY